LIPSAATFLATGTRQWRRLITSSSALAKHKLPFLSQHPQPTESFRPQSLAPTLRLLPWSDACFRKWGLSRKIKQERAVRTATSDGNSVQSHDGDNDLAANEIEACALRYDPASIDCWLRISRTRFSEMVRGARSVRWHPSCDGCCLPALYGLGHDNYRDHCRHRVSDRRIRSAGEHSGHHSACGCDLHRPSALWLQFDQADRRQRWESAVRVSGI